MSSPAGFWAPCNIVINTYLLISINSIVVSTYHIVLASVLGEVAPNKLGIRQQNLLDGLQPKPTRYVNDTVSRHCDITLS